MRFKDGEIVHRLRILSSCNRTRTTADSFVSRVSGGHQTLAKGMKDAQERFLDAVLDPDVKVRSVSGEVVGIPGITTVPGLIQWAEVEKCRRMRASESG